MPDAPPLPRRRFRLRRLLRATERCLAVIGAVLLVYQLGFDLAEVTSGSMAPTLATTDAGAAQNDWILSERLTTRFAPPPRLSLIQFQNEDGVKVVKRVVAYPGERVSVEDRGLRVDGAPVPGAAVRYVPAGKLRPTSSGPRSYDVPEQSVFVLGDNSPDSWDSRFFGGLERRRWRGRVVAVVWPPSRWSWLW